MTQRSRPRLTAEEKQELWSRWRAGESLSKIGRALGRRPGVIHRQVAANGGYAPAPRRRAPRVLSASEREEISRGLAEGLALRLIAQRLGRSPSTVSREVARHGGSERYRAARAPVAAPAPERRGWSSDAYHAAIATVNGVEYLLTWNCTHIANAHTRPRIEAACRALGYEPPIICTPQELTEEV